MSLIANIARAYQKRVGNTLALYGLKYDDVLVETPEVQRAVTWLPKEEQIARERRLARAADCGLKRTYLPESLQVIQQPMDHYLEESLNEAVALKEEREDLTRW